MEYAIEFCTNCLRRFFSLSTFESLAVCAALLATLSDFERGVEL